MPPKNKFTRDEIIRSALNVTRERGIAGLTARALAAKLGCSVKPVFGLFQNMEEVQREVLAALAPYTRTICSRICCEECILFIKPAAWHISVLRKRKRSFLSCFLCGHNKHSFRAKERRLFPESRHFIPFRKISGNFCRYNK